jgi:hypothetical protein
MVEFQALDFVSRADHEKWQVQTWIHDSFGPHLLNTKSVPFSLLILVNSAVAVILCVVFGLNIAVVNSVLELESL